MAHRQLETNSVHSSAYHSGWIRISEDSPWQIVAHSGDDGGNHEGEDVLPCTYLDLATQIHMQKGSERLKQKYGKYFRWNKDIHFHENLRLPKETTSATDSDAGDNKGILVLFEAMASEGVAVALSPQPAFSKGATTEVTFGAVGNTKTTILRKGGGKNNLEVSIPCRVCQEGTWNSFWVAIWKGKTYAGVGNSPGQKCLTFLKEGNDVNNNNITDDNKGVANGEEEASSDQPDISNNNNKEGNDNDKTMSNSKSLQVPRYVGLGNAAQMGRPIKIRNVHVTHVPSFVTHQLESITDSDVMMMMDADEVDNDALKEYQEQCRKAKARAEKFGIQYKEPDLASVVPWSQARKLRANPQKGFITGIDVTDPEELAKQEARKSRFGDVAVGVGQKRKLDDDHDDGVEDAEEEVSSEAKTTAAEASETMGEGNTAEQSIPVIQAWDNEELVRFQRADPPSSLWKNPPDGAADDDDNENEGQAQTTDEFAMETDKPTLAPEKIHVFSIDWSAFKQIRTDDLMAYFTIYGPSYVEWLGDLGCNILFEDKFSAVRAMKAMAQDLPSPPPAELNEGDEEYVPPDLGAMGWKLGRKLVRKIKNDRFGRRGTTARILMRPATSQDILVERPSSWPNPPPGFSTKRVLGPGSDYNTSAVDDEEADDDNYNNQGRKRKRRRRSSNRGNNNTNNSANNNGKNNKNASTRKRRQRADDTAAASQPSAIDRLNQGLSSRR